MGTHVRVHPSRLDCAAITLVLAHNIRYGYGFTAPVTGAFRFRFLSPLPLPLPLSLSLSPCVSLVLFSFSCNRALINQVMEAVATARVRCLAAQPDGRGAAARGGQRRGKMPELSPHQKLSSLCLTLLQRDWSEGDLK